MAGAHSTSRFRPCDPPKRTISADVRGGDAIPCGAAPPIAAQVQPGYSCVSNEEERVTSAQPLLVEIWADVVCPWCYIGKRRFEAALARFEYRDAVEVAYRSFELDPRAPATFDTTLDGMLAAKLGVPIEQAQAMNERVTRLAAGEGLVYRLDMARPGNSFDAHRLAHLAAASGRSGEMVERLYRAYFTEGRPIGDRRTLAQLATEVGLDAGEVDAVLATDRFADEVRSDQRLAASLGVRGVPFFALDRRFGVSGAQEAPTMLAALEAAWAARSSGTPSADSPAA